MKKALFQLGSVVSTPAALRVLGEHYVLPEDLLERHVCGDWGDVEVDDWERNNAALVDGSRLFSSYYIDECIRVWSVTESKSDDGVRSHTTIELPGDY